MLQKYMWVLIIILYYLRTLLTSIIQRNIIHISGIIIPLLKRSTIYMTIFHCGMKQYSSVVAVVCSGTLNSSYMNGVDHIT